MLPPPPLAQLRNRNLNAPVSNSATDLLFVNCQRHCLVLEVGNGYLCLLHEPDAEEFVADEEAEGNDDDEPVALGEGGYEMVEEGADEFGKGDVEEDFKKEEEFFLAL